MSAIMQKFYEFESCLCATKMALLFQVPHVDNLHKVLCTFPTMFRVPCSHINADASMHTIATLLTSLSPAACRHDYWLTNSSPVRHRQALADRVRQYSCSKSHMLITYTFMPAHWRTLIVTLRGQVLHARNYADILQIWVLVVRHKDSTLVSSPTC